MRYDGSMKVIQMSPEQAANLVTNSGNTAYGADVIYMQFCYALSCCGCLISFQWLFD